jgi:hypothetical protein
MSDTKRQKLQQAYNLIKANQRREAGELLVELLKTDRDNADAWWLLANASTKPDQREKALSQVLRLRPGDDRAQKMLEKLRAESEPPPRFTAPSSASWMSASTPPAPTPTVNEDDWMAGISQNMFSGPEPDDPFASTVVDQKDFGDPFGTSTYDNPFGDPFGESSTTVINDDPFAPQQDDPFGEPRAYDELFGLPEKAKRGTQRRRGSNPLAALLIVVAVIVLIAGACFLIASTLTNAGITAFNQAVANDPTWAAAMTQINDPTQLAGIQDILNDPTVAAAMTQFGDPTQIAEMMQMVGTPGAALNTSSLTMRGTISFGEPRRDTVSSSKDDGWTFNGSSGDQVIIEVKAYNSSLDPQVYLYGPNGEYLGENDDIDFANGNKNSRLQVTLPSSGEYTIVVSPFGLGGEYEVRVNR